MIIWLNGAFGSGKTTIANLLQQKFSSSFIYDPENLGDFLLNNLPKSMQKNDFQEYPEWREWNTQLLKKLEKEYTGVIIVPMTINREDYKKEMIDGLGKETTNFYHFWLDVSEKELLRRLSKREKHQMLWGTEKIKESVSFSKNLSKDIVIDNENFTPEEVVNKILILINNPKKEGKDDGK
jgi:gluconate kinase